MKLISWNVNGIRACAKGGFLGWLDQQNADIVCLQEIKARPEQLEPELAAPMGYTPLWNPAEKPGYSGTAILSRREPAEVRNGMAEAFKGLGAAVPRGLAEFDSEGRTLVAEFPEFVMINSYFPNSQRDHARLPFKLRFCKAMWELCDAYRAKGKNIVLCGDYNIAHKEIDLKNPRSNVNNAGFLPEERASLDEYVGRGYVDVFRRFEPGPGHYTWWSYRPGVREKNIGWRLDYHFVNPELVDRVAGASHQPMVKGSDHCPVVLELKR